MERKKLFLLIGALVIAVATAFFARALFADAAAPRAGSTESRAEPAPKVLVAQRTLPAGTIITADAVRYQPWPEELVQDAYFLSGETDMAKLLGTVARYPITAGEPVTRGALVAPGDRGFLAAALAPGMRAVTVPVSAKTGVGGFVFPGDRVDLVLTQTVSGAEGQALRASETIVGNLRVLATNQSTEKEVVDGKTVVRELKTVTLEVTPRIAEKIAVAQEIGDISLSLRSLVGSGAELDRAIASGEIDVPDGLDEKAEDALLRQAMNKPIETTRSYVTGGDVSRFQRRTMPPTRAAEPAPPPSVVTIAPEVRTSSQEGSEAASPSAGPVVRVTRGDQTVVVPVGGN